jgi:phospholipid transport system substrate-binding protein
MFMNMRFKFLTLAVTVIAAAPAASAFEMPSAANSLAPAMSIANNDNLITVAATSGTAAQNAIEKLGATAMAAISDKDMGAAKKKALFHQLLSQNFDMNTIGKFAAGRYWRQATPAQQAQFQSLYEQMVISVYTRRFDNYAGQTFRVTGNRVDESGDVVVSSVVQGGGAPVNVDWRLRNKGNGPRIIDVMVEGVSMAVTQRNDFAGIVEQGGGTFDALIEYLKKGGTSDVQK